MNLRGNPMILKPDLEAQEWARLWQVYNGKDSIPAKPITVNAVRMLQSFYANATEEWQIVAELERQKLEAAYQEARIQQGDRAPAPNPRQAKALEDVLKGITAVSTNDEASSASGPATPAVSVDSSPEDVNMEEVSELYDASQSEPDEPTPAPPKPKPEAKKKAKKAAKPKKALPANQPTVDQVIAKARSEGRIRTITAASPTPPPVKAPAPSTPKQTSSRGGGLKGVGKGGSKRHRPVLRDNIRGITKPDIRRLARRGGVKRIQGLIYEEARVALKVFLEEILHVAITLTDLANRKTVTAMDVVYALKRKGRTLYGYGA